MEHFIDAVKRYVDFEGRATRTQYWMFVLIYLIIYVVLTAIDINLGTIYLALIFAVAILLPSIGIVARRLHDTSRSGWWQLIGLIPIIGTIVLIVFLCQDSHPDNQYGPNPKGG